MIGTSGGEGVGPFRKIGGKERACEGKVEDAGAPNEGYGEPSKNPRGVEESESQVCGPVKVRGRGGDLIRFERPERVRYGVVDIEVTQRKRGESGYGKYNVRWNRAGIVEATFCTIGVDNREASRGGVEKPVRGEEVQSHDITPSKKTGEERNCIQKGIIKVKANAGFAATTGGRGKKSKGTK